ncbi:MAG TPA: N-acetylmuramoyl-L-alanine amidase-like domain-containing protein [bacterium]|nr:N-acetylmuramoyl-L-alanine amidase-like domain-containing protein [bacterium]
MQFSRPLLFVCSICACLFWSCSSTPGEKAKTGGAASEPSPASSPSSAPPASVRSDPPPTPPARTEPWKAFTPKLTQSDLVARFVEASRLLLGVPYVNGPLGEGEVGGPDPEPRYDLTRADCVTFLEESLALALAAPHSDDSYVPILDAIRYHDGKVGFASRNHYMVLDWIPSNSWLLEDVTDDVVSGGHTRKIEKQIDRAAFLRDHGVEPRSGIDKLEKIKIEMIPIDDVRAAEKNLRSGDLIMWVAKKDGIDIAHTGMVVRAKDGALIHRHGSSKAGISLDEPFFDYATRVAPVFEGIMVLRLKPKAEPPGLAANE